MRLNKASKEVLKVLAGTVPGSGIFLAAFDDDIDRLLTGLFSKPQLDELESAATNISEIIANSSMPYRDRDPGASVSAAYDFLQSVRDSKVTFEILLGYDFDLERVIRHFEEFRPTDWQYASGQRKQLWQQGIRQFSEFLIHFYLSTPRYQGYLIAELLKRTGGNQRL